MKPEDLHGFVFSASSYILIKDKQNYGQYKLFFSNEKQKRGCQANLFAFVCISFSMIILTNEFTSRNVG